MGKISNLIRSIDSFGRPIEMRYKGGTAYQTTSGGVCTLVLMFFVTWFTVEQIIQLIQMSDPKVVKNNIYHSKEDFGTRTAKEIHLDIGIGAYSNENDNYFMHDIKGYGSFRTFQVDVGGSSVFETYEIGMKPCMQMDTKIADFSKKNPYAAQLYQGTTCVEPNDTTFENFQ